MYKLLIVEDDISIVNGLKDYLGAEGFEVENAATQEAAIQLIDANSYDLVLLDIMLLEGNGFAVCQAAKNRDFPVIFLTASSDEYSVVAGLDMGADDFISKPFRPRELLARIKSVIRRCNRESGPIVIEHISVDADKGKVTVKGNEVILSALEYRLLLVLINNRGSIMTRTKLLEEIWDVAGDYVNDNTLTVYIKRLRDKIETDPQNPTIIKTIRGRLNSEKTGLRFQRLLTEHMNHYQYQWS